jgi:hypothetical protein
MSTIKNPQGGDPVGQLAPREPGSPTPDEADRGGAPAPEVIRRGYEEDGYDTKSVISVPVLVVGFFVAAFTAVTIMFSYFRHTPDDPMANPQTVKDNSRPLNERIAATPERGRPEPLVMLDERGGNARSITRPPLKEGNPPEYHPEDIRPSLENTPTLFETQWDGKSKFARVPLSEAKAAALKGGLLKARADGHRPPASSDVPTGSNAGRGPPQATKEGKH